MEGRITVGEFLAGYLRHVGVEDYFVVPGDFNLLLLDEMLHNKDIRLINCCNELNAGYAADGYARAKGIGALVITYGVGALSAVNAIAGCYAENKPVIIISGGPNSNSMSRGELIHHSMGELRYDFVKRIFGEITAASVVIQHPSEVVEGIHKAVSSAIAFNKPVYIEIACNIVQEKILPPHLPSLQSLVVCKKSDPRNLEEAVKSAIQMLNWAKHPVIVIGSKLRVACKNAHSCKQVMGLIEKSQYATALMADAKGMLHDTHPNNIGVYWGKVSVPTHATQEIVETSDARIFIGPIFADYSTCGGTIVLDHSKMIQVDWHHVQIGDQSYCNVEMLDFVEGITDKVNANRKALDAYLKKVPQHHEKVDLGAKDVWITNFKKGMSNDPDGYVTAQRMLTQIQKLILDKTAGAKYTVLTEAGSAWFSSLKLRLPLGVAHEVQMMYGSIGWSVGATLGYALAAAKDHRRVVALIGDGSFQLTAQEVSTMIRYHANPIIFLINNFGYTVEEEIHSGPYNRIKNWDYAGLMDVFNAKEFYGNDTEKEQDSSGKGMGYRVTRNKDLDTAIERALEYTQGPSLIEVRIARDDCTTELNLFGKVVSEFNSRKDAIQSR